jgi:hypothetical protein
MQLFTREGQEFNGTVNHNEAGKAVHTVNVVCDRCHVIGGRRLWIMGIENNRPYSKTGFECWTCGNTGVRATRQERLFSADELARVNKAAATRAAKRFAAEQAAAAAKAAERATAEAAYRAANADFLAKIATLCVGDGQAFWDRLAADLLHWLRAPSERQAALVEAEIAKRVQNASSAFVGAVGDKVTLTITVERIIVLESEFYGRNFITIARTAEGNVVTYKGRTDIGDKGETVTVKASVKEHVLYNGVNQTVIQRPKVVEVV